MNEEMEFAYWKISRDIRNETIPRYLVDIVSQQVGGDPVEEAEAFAWVFGNVSSAHIRLTGIHVGDTPRGDSERKENAAILATLPHPYRVEVDMEQQCASADGDLYWDEAITLDEWKDGQTIGDSIIVPPDSCPLEIGYTRPATTLRHLRAPNGFARWPYHSDVIWVLRCDEGWLRSTLPTAGLTLPRDYLSQDSVADA